ncbi:unnamed protein product, partial [Discosporangium mesarthrocarpum]
EPQDLDEAILDRVDEVIHLPLPDLPQRRRLAQQYFDLHLAPLSRSGALWLHRGAKIEIVLERLALATEGLSGREISKIFLSVKV